MDTQFYRDPNTGEFRPKYLLILASIAGGDFAARVLTSLQHGRPESPECFHGEPYPSYFLGVLGPPLGKRSWLDLRRLDDIDGYDLTRHLKAGRVKFTAILPPKLLRPAMECAAAADDTSIRQERAIRAAIEQLPA